MDNQFLAFVNFLGGLSLFLLSMDFLGSGMKKLSSNHLKSFLQLVTKNRFGGLIFGFLFTLLFQSSSAATVVLVGFIDAGILTLIQTLPVLLGSGVGTTIAAQLISLNLAEYSLLIVTLGVFPFIFGKKRVQAIGKVILAVGLIFFSIKIMSGSIMPFRSSNLFLEIISYLKNPLIGILTGLIITALIHSSAGFIGLLIVLGHNQMIDFQQTLPMLVGANIGTTATAHLAAVKSSVDAKKMAIINTFFRLFTAFVVLIFIDYWAEATLHISAKESDIARKIANAHTIFNILMVLIIFPFTNYFYNALQAFWKTPTPKPRFRLKYLSDEILNYPDYFMPLLKKEIGVMFAETEKIIANSIIPFITKSNNDVLQKVANQEDKVDFYKDEIAKIILRVNTMQENGKNVSEIFVYLHIINELEQISDIVAVNIVKLAKKWNELDASFSSEGLVELINYHNYCLSHYKSIYKLFLLFPKDISQLSKSDKILKMSDNFGYNLEVHHYKRLLSESSNSQPSSEVHVELLNELRIINGRIIGLARLLSHQH